MIVIENVKILLENERLEEGKIQRKGLVTYPITAAPPQKKGCCSCDVIFPEGVDTVGRELRVSILVRIVFAFRILKNHVGGEKKTRSASEMMNAFLLKAVLNVLEFNQNYLFLVSFAVVSFTLVH